LLGERLQELGTGLLVESPQAARLGEGESEARHFQILTAHAVQDLVSGNGDEVLVHAASSGLHRLRLRRFD